MNKYEHYTDAVPELKGLISKAKDFYRYNAKQNEISVLELNDLLLWCIEQTEEESSKEGLGVAPYYYEELANLNKLKGRTDLEIEVLERFAQQKHAPGVKPPRLLERLQKLKDSQ